MLDLKNTETDHQFVTEWIFKYINQVHAGLILNSKSQFLKLYLCLLLKSRCGMINDETNLHKKPNETAIYNYMSLYGR